MVAKIDPVNITSNKRRHIRAHRETFQNHQAEVK